MESNCVVFCIPRGTAAIKNSGSNNTASLKAFFQAAATTEENSRSCTSPRVAKQSLNVFDPFCFKFSHEEWRSCTLLHAAATSNDSRIERQFPSGSKQSCCESTAKSMSSWWKSLDMPHQSRRSCLDRECSQQTDPFLAY
jgi:hypothetical protein